MSWQLKKKTVFGWFFAGFGAWGLLSLPLDWWMSHSEEFKAVVGISPFYQQAVGFRSLPEFYPLVAVLSVAMIAAGFGFLKRKSWAPVCAFAYLILAAIGGTSLCVRYTQVSGGSEGAWSIWPMWLLGMAFLGVLAFLLRRPTISLGFPSSPAWQTYEKVHWKLFNLGGRLFGLAAIFVGGIMGLWGLTLLQDRRMPHPSGVRSMSLLDPNASIPVNGVPTTDLAPKLVTFIVGLVMVVIGILFLIAKPFAPRKPTDRPNQ